MARPGSLAPAGAAPGVRAGRPVRAAAPPCPDCGGTGWKVEAPESGSPVATKCGCRDASRAPRGLEEIGVPPNHARAMQFDTFDELAGAPKRVKGIVQRWARDFPDVKAGLLLSGPAGVGKTHLAVAALHHILRERKIAAPARFEYVPRLLREVQVERDLLLVDEDRLDQLARARIVVFDDLGADTGWAERVKERLLYILNRCVQGGGFLICTTAFPVHPGSAQTTLQDQISARGVSLLRETCRFEEMPGEDYRDTVITHRLNR